MIRYSASPTVLYTLTAVLLSASFTRAARPTVEQVNEVLDLAEIAASNGMMTLSATAVSRALEFGPPTIVSERGDKTIVHVGGRVDTISPVPSTPLEAIQQRIPRSIFSLSNIWRDKAEPNEIYLALRDAVLPPQRPAEIFLYNLPLRVEPLQPNRLPPAQSVAQELVLWAIRAGQIDDLQKHISAHDVNRSVESSALQLMCALHSGNEESFREHSEWLRERMIKGTSRSTAEMVAFVGLSYLQTGDAPDIAATLLEAAGTTMAGIDTLQPQEDSPTRAVLLAAARCRFSLSQNDMAIDLLRQYVSLKVRGKYGIASRGLSNGQRDVVGRELFRRGLIDEAVQLVGDEVVAGIRRRYRIPGLAGAAVSSSPSVPDASKVERPISIVAANASATNLAEEKIWFCSLDTKTKESRVLFSLPDFSSATTPAISPDGTEVAFAATLPGEAVTSDTQLYIASLNGQTMRCLGRGTLPSWSPEGRRLLYSSYSPNRGIWITRADGNDRLLVDETGWGGQWSPNGAMIAYTKLVDRKWDFVVYDMVEDEFSRVLENQAVFAQIFGGFQWTKDSKHLIFKATDDRGASNNTNYMLARANISGPPHWERIFGRRGYMGGNLAVSDSIASPVVAVLKATSNSPERLFYVGPNVSVRADEVPGQIANRRNICATWMPDGTTLIYISKPVSR